MIGGFLRRLLRRVCPACVDGDGTRQTLEWLRRQTEEAQRAVSPLERALQPDRRRTTPRAPQRRVRNGDA